MKPTKRNAAEEQEQGTRELGPLLARVFWISVGLGKKRRGEAPAAADGATAGNEAATADAPAAGARRRAIPGAWLVRLSGPLDQLWVDTFRETMARLLAQPCRPLVLDLRRVSYADSQGIRALLHLRDQILRRRGRLRLILPEASRVWRTLHLLRVDALFQIYATPAEAWHDGRREEAAPSAPARSRGRRSRGRGYPVSGAHP